MENIVQHNKGDCIFLHAQLRVKNFYEKQGYLQYDEVDMDENCPHIWMYKRLSKTAEDVCGRQKGGSSA